MKNLYDRYTPDVVGESWENKKKFGKRTECWRGKMKLYMYIWVVEYK